MAMPHELEMDIWMQTESPTREAMLGWVYRYPEHRLDIIDLFSWWFVDCLIPEPDLDRPLTPEEKAVCDWCVERAMKRIREFDAERRGLPVARCGEKPSRNC